MTTTRVKYFYTFRIYQIKFAYSERKKKQPNFYGIFSQTLPISTSFTTILKIMLSQLNARTPPGFGQNDKISSSDPTALTVLTGSDDKQSNS